MPSSVLQIFGVGTALLAGYIFIRFSPYRRFAAERLRTDRYALHIVGWALIFFFFGTVVDIIFDLLLPLGKSFSKVAKHLEKEGIPPAVIYACIFALIGSFADRFAVLYYMRKDAALLENPNASIRQRMRLAALALYVRKSSDASLRTMYRASFWHKLLMVTMKSGKVYVGRPLQTFDPFEFSTSLRLYPVASGYRDSTTKNVSLPTQYKNLHDKLIVSEEANESSVDPTDPLRRDEARLRVTDDETCKIDLEDIGVVLIWSEIECFTIFDENISRVFGLPSPIVDAAADGVS